MMKQRGSKNRWKDHICCINVWVFFRHCVHDNYSKLHQVNTDKETTMPYPATLMASPSALSKRP